MSTLYVENVPEELYRGLRKRARENRNSIAAEVISLLERNIVTAEEIRRREQFYQKMAKLRSKQAERKGSFPTVEQMIREDRER
jgi:plasmid stability protein